MSVDTLSKHLAGVGRRVRTQEKMNSPGGRLFSKESRAGKERVCTVLRPQEQMPSKA